MPGGVCGADITARGKRGREYWYQHEGVAWRQSIGRRLQTRKAQGGGTAWGAAGWRLAAGQA